MKGILTVRCCRDHDGSRYFINFFSISLARCKDTDLNSSMSEEKIIIYKCLSDSAVLVHTLVKAKEYRSALQRQLIPTYSPPQLSPAVSTHHPPASWHKELPPKPALSNLVKPKNLLANCLWFIKSDGSGLKETGEKRMGGVANKL